jgi:hypothetical protein
MSISALDQILSKTRAKLLSELRRWTQRQQAVGTTTPAPRSVLDQPEWVLSGG